MDWSICRNVYSKYDGQWITLIEKLKVYGISGKLLQWIKNFLYSRKMRVRVRNSFSEWVSVLSGVPQGSVLGPLLFLLFVNDLPDWIRNNIRMFADDTKIWCVVKQVVVAERIG